MYHPVKRFVPHLMVAVSALVAISFPAAVSGNVQSLARWFLVSFDWLTLLVASGCVLFCLAIILLPVGKRRIGGEDAKTEFRTITWLAMLFAAGMGAGLVFWGAAEPLIHTVSPPPGGAGANTAAAVRDALAITQFHWALHAWSVYAVAGLAVAIFAASDRAILPSGAVLGMPKPIRRVIDWVALLAVIFGIVASVGQGVIQIAAGADRLTNGAIGAGTTTQIATLVLLTGAYLVSASSGLRRGIAILSNVNMAIAGMLAVFVLVAGATTDIFSTFWQSFVSYIEQFFTLSSNLRPQGAPRQWTRDWSLTYLLWWVAWTPFMGVFIARISRGRRLREFVLGVVFVPSVVTLVWFSIFGGQALSLNAAGIDLGVSDFATAPAATYEILAHLPFSGMFQSLTLVLVFVFILTSADSGSYVLAIFSRGKTGEPPVVERLFWGSVIAVLSGATILSADGQNATRAFAVAGAIPLVILLIVQAGSVIWAVFPRKAQIDE